MTELPMFKRKDEPDPSMARNKIAVLALLALSTLHVDAQSSEGGEIFAGIESIRIEVSTRESNVPTNGYVVVRCEVNNVSGSTLLVSDTESAGGKLAVVVRDENGTELKQDALATDSYGESRFTWQEKMRLYWRPLFSRDFMGTRIDFSPGMYSKIRPGHRYKVSARLVSMPDAKTSQQDIKSVFPYGARILRGEVESAPIMIAVEPPCCKVPRK